MKRAIIITFSDISGDANCHELNPKCKYELYYNEELDLWIASYEHEEDEE